MIYRYIIFILTAVMMLVSIAAAETDLIDPNSIVHQAEQQAIELHGEIFDIVSVASDDLDEQHQQTVQKYASATSETVISEVLANQLQWHQSSDMIRVIIHLQEQPNPQIAKQVRNRYQPEMRRSRDKIRQINNRYKIKRNPRPDREPEKYRQEVIAMTNADYQEIRSINESLESLEYLIKKDIRDALLPEIANYQQSVIDTIIELGGIVENQTVAGNTIIASVPAGTIEVLSYTSKIRRIVQDNLKDSHLNNAARAVLLETDLIGGSLWDNGQTGGTYDPAILDSGTNLNHPALKDDSTRTNFYSWYLSSAKDSSSFDDAIDEDDRQGHGTHVMGIVSSYGSAGYTSHLGMAFGAEKTVTLKAGFLKSNGNASMYDSDAMSLVNRALHSENDLRPTGTFNDDIDGINLSYGSLVNSSNPDETDYSRFWDSVVDSDPGLAVTISAGNNGPDNTRFSTPGCAYNPITVANVTDYGTETREDDYISSSSTRGPTSDGRRKPDIAAPGSSISSCNNDWQSESDFTSKSGTSMASPMVLGIAMNLMDAGVTDFLDIKSLLINTAQKNNTAMDFESDSDGWSKAYGWGYINAWAAYYHRSDVHSGTLNERGQAGSFHLYKGRMRDEKSSQLNLGDGGLFSNEGRDKATLVWNRHAQYKASDYPTSYNNLSDLNLRLYEESTNSLIDSDLSTVDNVHQVRVDANSTIQDVVIKVYAWNTNFPHGGSTEDYSLATEEDFVKVDLPKQFGSSAIWPEEMEPGEEREFEIWIHNNSDISSHDNSLELVLPAGWTMVSGSETTNLGTIEADTQSIHVKWTLKTQDTIQDNVYVRVYLSHDSYGQRWDRGATWIMPVDVKLDDTPPSPTTMSFSSNPHKQGTDSIAMTAAYASDTHGPVEYFFDYYNSPTDGTGGSNSTWQTSRDFTDSTLQPNNQYGYRVRARDNAATKNYTDYSKVVYEVTNIESPTGITFSMTTPTSLQVRSTNTPTNLNLGDSGIIFENITTGTSSGWRHDNNYWTSGSLKPNTLYSFYAKARNMSGEETGFGPIYGKYTMAVHPKELTISNITQTSFDVSIPNDGNPAYTQYAIHISDGTDSYYLKGSGGNNGNTPVWKSAASWGKVSIRGLQSGDKRYLKAKAINGNGITSGWGNTVTASTSVCGDQLHPYPTGDIDRDCTVNVKDLALLAEYWLDDCDASNSFCNRADINTSGLVDIVDYSLIAENWLTCTDPDCD